MSMSIVTAVSNGRGGADRRLSIDGAFARHSPESHLFGLQQTILPVEVLEVHLKSTCSSVVVSLRLISYSGNSHESQTPESSEDNARCALPSCEYPEKTRPTKLM